MILLNYLPFLGLAIIFWNSLYFVAFLLERITSGKKQTPIASAALNLLDTFIALSFSFVYLLNHAFFKEASIEAAVPLVLISMIAFYLSDSLFQFVRGARDLAMIVHHLISIAGCIWILSMPRLWFESIILVISAKITFQYYLNNLVRSTGLMADKFLSINAWWNWNLFWLMRVLVVPFISAYCYFTYDVSFAAGIFLAGLNIWGFMILPNVWKYNRRYLKNTRSFIFWESVWNELRLKKSKPFPITE